MSESHPPGIGRRVYVSNAAAADAAVEAAAAAAAASAPHGPARHSCQKKSPSPNLSTITLVRSTHTERRQTQVDGEKHMQS